LRKLDGIESSSGDIGRASDISSAVGPIKERLADIHDLQAEISLEGERFSDAVSDLKAALALKETLLPLEDPSIAECHYKLSLALEFSSITRQSDGENSTHNGQITSADSAMRKDAIKHMEIAIKSCKLRMSQEQQKLDNGEITIEDKVTAAKRKIANVKDIVADMEQRVGQIFLLLF
jgi:HAT1-interacting factor 1